MSDEHWQRVDDLFHAVLARTGESRRVFLDEACAGDDALRLAVDRLVRAHDAASGFMSIPAAGEALGLLSEPEAAVDGVMVGPYRIVREIGRGGTGAVYLAERADDQFHKQVAVKLIKRGLDTDAVLRRFRDERQILAGLEQPNIARLLDAGTTDDGRPYFLMEYVDGLPIDRYCREHALSLERRLELFLQVCTAVSYAHQRLVVHRDIKPSNIFVTADGTPKLLDFGIAKVIHAASDADTLATVPGARPMTPAYASPEQLQGMATTTLGDVYSLGVLFYELLVERPPFQFETHTPEAVARIVTTVDPTRPSEVAVDLRNRLQGDLDTIALTALQREPGRRYQSVDAFADDIRRHMLGLPILARKDAAMYRAAKFVRRNRLAVGAASTVLATLVVGIAATSLEAIRAGRAERASRLERDRSTAVTNFLQNDLLAQASSHVQGGPTTRPDPNLTVRAALDRAAARIDGKFADPAIEASLRQTIGETYEDLTAFAEAETQLNRAAELRRRSLGATHPDTLRTLSRLAVLYFWQGKYAPASATLTSVLQDQRRLLGDTHPDTLASMHALGNVVSAQGRHAEAEALYRDAVDASRRALGADNQETLSSMNDLVAEYTNEGKYVQAAELGGQLVAVKRRVLGAEHPSTLLTMSNLGVVYRNLGKYADAEALLTTCLEIRRRVVGADHIDTLASLNSLALVYQAEAKYAEAEPLFLQGLAARRRVLGEEHPQTIAVLNNLAELYRREGKRQEAEASFAHVAEVRRRVLGADHPNTANALTSLAGIKLEQRSYAEAERLLREALAAYTKKTPDSWQRYYAESLLGRSLAGLGKASEGRALIESASRALQQRESSIPFENRMLVDEARRWANEPRE